MSRLAAASYARSVSLAAPAQPAQAQSHRSMIPHFESGCEKRARVIRDAHIVVN